MSGVRVTRYKKRKKAPRKVVWYFPITPRLQRYFVDPKLANLLRWHANREEKKQEDDENDPEINKKDKMMSHPKDGSEWQALNFKHPEFGKDPRNIMLGASTDGVNPFGSQRSTIAPGLCLCGCTTFPLVVHEEEVHSHDYDN